MFALVFALVFALACIVEGSTAEESSEPTGAAAVKSPVAAAIDRSDGAATALPVRGGVLPPTGRTPVTGDGVSFAYACTVPLATLVA